MGYFHLLATVYVLLTCVHTTSSQNRFFDSEHIPYHQAIQRADTTQPLVPGHPPPPFVPGQLPPPPPPPPPPSSFQQTPSSFMQFPFQESSPYNRLGYLAFQDQHPFTGHQQTYHNDFSHMSFLSHTGTQHKDTRNMPYPGLPFHHQESPGHMPFPFHQTKQHDHQGHVPFSGPPTQHTHLGLMPFSGPPTQHNHLGLMPFSGPPTQHNNQGLMPFPEHAFPGHQTQHNPTGHMPFPGPPTQHNHRGHVTSDNNEPEQESSFFDDFVEIVEIMLGLFGAAYNFTSGDPIQQILGVVDFYEEIKDH